jgi:hypothetical protein
MTWRGGKIPPGLIAFIEAVFEAILKTAKSEHPDDAARILFPKYGESPSKFRRLMLRGPTAANESELRQKLKCSLMRVLVVRRAAPWDPDWERKALEHQHWLDTAFDD